MSDPERLFDHGSPFERSLLQSSESEEPSSRLEEKILASLAAAPSAGGEPGPASDATAEAARGGARFLLPTVFAALAIGLVGGAIALGRAPESSPDDALGKPAASAPVSLPPAAPEAPSAPDVPTVSLDALPSAPPARPAPQAPTRAATTTAPAPDDASSLEREIALLDAVKAKLGAGATADAARALDGYDAEFPRGTLRPEATVLRIRTLIALGKRAEAQALADDFLARHPSSVHASRIRALLAD
ncbi:MAG: hypothetical protein KF795_33960 [Labilithrix sp.]|nr:hypothetical protein [Labilithrix sp.]